VKRMADRRAGKTPHVPEREKGAGKQPRSRPQGGRLGAKRSETRKKRK
jgi:hypothetical protein